MNSPAAIAAAVCVLSLAGRTVSDKPYSSQNQGCQVRPPTKRREEKRSVQEVKIQP